MPVPAVLAGPVAVEGGILASDAASNVIAIVTLAAGSGLGLAALPAETVGIGNISLALAPQADIYAGDDIIFTAQIDVCFGCIDDDGKGGTIKIELIEEGKLVLHTLERPATSPKETFSFRYKAKTISHGTKIYYIRITVTGEEDLSYWPSGDSEVSRTRESDTVTLEVKKPLELTIVPLATSVVHGQAARVMMKVSNKSNSDALLVARLDSSYDNLHARFLKAKETDVRIIDHVEMHGGDDHTGEVPWYFEPVQHIFHTHHIEVAGNTVAYSQIDPEPLVNYDPVALTCTGTMDKRVGYIPDGWNGLKEREGEYAYACMTINDEDKPLACTATFSDHFGNSIKASMVNDRLQFMGVLTGVTGVIRFTPANPIYKPYSLSVLLDKDHLKELADTFKFTPSAIPPLKGIVFIKSELLPVNGCRVELKHADGKIIYRTMTGTDGRFKAYSNARNIDSTDELLLTIKLPWDITYNWKNQAMTRKVSKEEILDQTLLVFHPEVEPAEDWIEIGGNVIIRDSVTRKENPVKGIEVVVTDEMGDIHDKTITDVEGRYLISIKPGQFFISAVNTEAAGYIAPVSKFFSARSTKKDVDICLSLPRPVLIYNSPRVIKVKAAHDPSFKLGVLNKGKIIKEYTSVNSAFFINAGDFDSLSGLETAFIHGDICGPRASLQFG